MTSFEHLITDKSCPSESPPTIRWQVNSLKSYILSEMHGNVWYIVVVYRHLAPLTFSAYYFNICHPTCCFANCIYIVPSFVEIRFDVSWLSKRHLISWGSCLQTPLVLHACIHTTRHPCNPSSKNPGYGPAFCEYSVQYLLSTASVLKDGLNILD